MKKADAEREIVRLLKEKFANRPHPGAMGGFAEYQELVAERPDLFTFRSAGDKWQIVQGWINKHGLLKKTGGFYGPQNN